MAVEHGIPHRLPVLPSLAPKNTEHINQGIPDPNTLSKNYLNMLASTPQDATALNTTPAAEGPLDLDSMLSDILQENPSNKDGMSTNDMSFPAFSNAFHAASQQAFLTSPLLADYDATSPLFGSTNDLDFTSPVMANDPGDFSSPLFADVHGFGTSDNGCNFDSIPLFAEGDATPPLVHDSSPLLDDFHSSPQLSTPQNAVGTYDALIADQPSLFGSAFNYTSGIQPAATVLPSKRQEVPAEPMPAPTPAPAIKPRRKQNRKVIATGTRRNLTPASLLGEDAPTQTRSYALPSITSKKDMPVTFARKRVATAMANEEDDFLPDLPPNATETEQIEWKRRQNTIAARKSRKRKLEHQQNLEVELDRMRKAHDLWKTRALTLRGVLKRQGDDDAMEEWDEED